jgi:hypothetical protein
MRLASRALLSLTLILLAGGRASAQDAMSHDHMDMDMTGAQAGWSLMQQGAVHLMLNRQGGPRGGTDVRAPNWWMGMASRPLGRGEVTFEGMLSLDPATVGARGYREIFQVGESYQGRPLVDRQHPHDLFMQLAASWRVPLGTGTGLTLAGGPVGEPALGPASFMHRLSAAGQVLAPLSHHTFDSTHVAFGVVTAGLDHGAWTAEASVFNGREPDEHRWDFDFGPLDSVSARVKVRPGRGWEVQASTAHLTRPERLEAGDIQRTTVSAAWSHASDGVTSAVTAGYGVNATDHGRRGAVFVEASRRKGANLLFGRAELVQVETALLLVSEADVSADPADTIATGRDLVGAISFGARRDILRSAAAVTSAGAVMQFYAVPGALTASHGAHPVSFQVFISVAIEPGPPHGH